MHQREVREQWRRIDYWGNLKKQMEDDGLEWDGQQWDGVGCVFC